MIKNYLVLLYTAWAAFGYSQSPLTLNNSNMPGNGDTLRYTNVQPQSAGSYSQAGANYNWDFSNVTSTSEGVRSFKSALQTPYAFYFLSLNEYGEKMADTLVGGTGTISITKYYNFYKKTSSPNAFIADGVGLTISGLPVASYYSDKDELYNFPMTYQRYDSTTFRFSTLATTLIPIAYSKTGYRVTSVDGWGTVVTPYGTANCLRLVTTQYSRDTTAISFPPFPPIKLGVQNNQRSYQWFTQNSKIPFFEVTGNLLNGNFTATQVRYRGYNMKATGVVQAQPDVSALELYPNPVRDRLWLSGDLQAASTELMDLNGRLLGSCQASQMGGLVSIDVSILANGLYILKVEQGQKPVYFKFIKE